MGVSDRVIDEEVIGEGVTGELIIVEAGDGCIGTHFITLLATE